MFGMLVQMGDGKYCLEDADDRVELVMEQSVSIFVHIRQPINPLEPKIFQGNTP